MRPFASRHGIVVALALIVACGGSSETVSVVDDPVQPQETDDKAPPPATYDDSLTYTRGALTENHSRDRFRFDVAAYDDDAEKAAAEVLYPSHAAALAAHERSIPSVQTVVTYAKQLDDTIYAGIEDAMESGVDPTLASKRAILSDAITWLAAHRSADADAAIVALEAALELGGATGSAPADLAGAIASAKSSFLSAALLSTPISFYTWSDELRGVWQQDRFLQQPLAAGASCALAQAIAADSARQARYTALVALYAHLTNPVKSSLVDLVAHASSAACGGDGSAHAFLSESASVENTLFDELYPNGVPDGADLMKDLIAAIRNGTVDLAPKDGEGWYQYQEYALETLLVTDKSEERAKVAFMARYKERLVEAFETLLTEHRETHAKQEGPVAAAVYEPQTPDFRVEPVATVYVRHARSYVFLESALDAVLGPAVLDQAHAVGAGGPEGETLRARIERARDLYFGLYVMATQDLGFHPKLDAAGDPAQANWTRLAERAQTWVDGLASDPVAAADVRVAIPIADLGGGRARYWAVIGVRTTLAGYSFLDGDDVSPPKPDLQARVPLPTEQFLEVTSSSTPMTRDELRAICDREKTADAIAKAIEAR
jgi:hypothetical protein